MTTILRRAIVVLDSGLQLGEVRKDSRILGVASAPRLVASTSPHPQVTQMRYYSHLSVLIINTTAQPIGRVHEHSYPHVAKSQWLMSAADEEIGFGFAVSGLRKLLIGRVANSRRDEFDRLLFLVIYRPFISGLTSLVLPSEAAYRGILYPEGAGASGTGGSIGGRLTVRLCVNLRLQPSFISRRERSFT